MARRRVWGSRARRSSRRCSENGTASEKARSPAWGLEDSWRPFENVWKTSFDATINNSVKDARKISRDLREYGEALWTFSKVEGVEPTNNAAERAVRKGVLWRKGSFGSHSAEGSRFAERMLTVSESLRAQGRSILDFVEDSIRASLTGDARPSLLPAAC